MELQRLLIWILFAISLGLTAGGVLIFFRRKERATIPSLRLFQVYLVMIFAYGYYAIWSDVFIGQFFTSDDLNTELLSRISNLLYLISTPFLLIGSLLLILWVKKVVSKTSRVLFAGLIVTFAIAVIAFWQLIPITLNSQIREVSTLLSLLAVIYVTSQLIFAQISFLESRYRLIMASLFLGFGGLQYIAIAGSVDNLYAKLIYLFLFYLLNTGIGVLLVYYGEFPLTENSGDPESFNRFFDKYSITAREQEVILEIYKGKTNKEIADTLFVTVQTIKDHTHRIYQKTDVKNRNQLATLLRKFDTETISL